MEKTLFISDLDGTLLNTNAEISDKTAKIINHLIKKGMYFTFATARTIYSAGKIASPIDVNVPCVLNNGASIYDIKKEEYIRNAYFKRETAEKVVHAFVDRGLRCFVFKFVGNTLTTCYDFLEGENMKEYVKQRESVLRKRFLKCCDVMEVLDEKVIYINSSGSYEKLYPVSEAVRGIPGADFVFYGDTYSDDWFLETFSSQASKGNAVHFLREKYGFDRVVAFGDNLNDLSLFSRADVKIAVGNAHDELKKVADIVIGGNNENGVAQYLASLNW